MKLPNLARTFREISDFGKKGFYEGTLEHLSLNKFLCVLSLAGRVARSIVDLIQSQGGLITLEDLQSHTSSMDNPISVNYRG